MKGAASGERSEACLPEATAEGWERVAGVAWAADGGLVGEVGLGAEAIPLDEYFRTRTMQGVRVVASHGGWTMVVQVGLVEVSWSLRASKKERVDLIHKI